MNIPILALRYKEKPPEPEKPLEEIVKQLKNWDREIDQLTKKMNRLNLMIRRPIAGRLFFAWWGFTLSFCRGFWPKRSKVYFRKGRRLGCGFFSFCFVQLGVTYVREVPDAA